MVVMPTLLNLPSVTYVTYVGDKTAQIGNEECKEEQGRTVPSSYRCIPLRMPAMRRDI